MTQKDKQVPQRIWIDSGDGLRNGAWSAGQCSEDDVLYVPASVYDELVKQLRDKVEATQKEYSALMNTTDITIASLRSQLVEVWDVAIRELYRARDAGDGWPNREEVIAALEQAALKDEGK